MIESASAPRICFWGMRCWALAYSDTFKTVSRVARVCDFEDLVSALLDWALSWVPGTRAFPVFDEDRTFGGLLKLLRAFGLTRGREAWCLVTRCRLAWRLMAFRRPVLASVASRCFSALWRFRRALVRW